MVEQTPFPVKYPPAGKSARALRCARSLDTVTKFFTVNYNPHFSFARVCLPTYVYDEDGRNGEILSFERLQKYALAADAHDREQVSSSTR